MTWCARCYRGSWGAPVQGIHNAVRGMYTGTNTDVHDDIAAVSKSMQFIANRSVR